ncbi:MAG: ABC transporter permease [Chloroflexi bacterium]|nr:ABC transporter permease [Chloroflexota bacterium]
MNYFLLRRTLMVIPLMLAVATLVFMLMHIIPGRPGRAILGDAATDEAVFAVEERLGLHRPLPVQYVDWLGGILRLDMGKSVISSRPIMKDLLDRLPRSIELMALAALFALLFGVPLGILAAVKRNGFLDIIVGTTAIVGLSLPNYVVGTLLVLVFGLQLGWFVSSGYVAPNEDLGGHIKLLILPMVTLGVSMGAVVLRMTRSSMLEVLALDYVRTARAKGLTERVVMYRHALRNALNPVVTVVGLQIGSLLGGAVIVEYIFNWPGLATFLINSIVNRDYPATQGAILLIAGAFVTINLVVDLLYGVLDPRIRYS